MHTIPRLSITIPTAYRSIYDMTDMDAIDTPWVPDPDTVRAFIRSKHCQTWLGWSVYGDDIDKVVATVCKLIADLHEWEAQSASSSCPTPAPYQPPLPFAPHPALRVTACV